MNETDFEFAYRIARYQWAKDNGLLDELYPVIGRLTDEEDDTDA